MEKFKNVAHTIINILISVLCVITIMVLVEQYKCSRKIFNILQNPNLHKNIIVNYYED